MYLKNITVGAFTLFLLVTGCNKNHDKKIPTQNSSNYSETSKFEIVDKLVLPLDSLNNFNQKSISFQKSNKSDAVYLTFLNIVDNSFVKYDVDTKTKTKIVFETEGENGIGFISYDTVHLFENENSIFVYQPFQTRLYHFDSLGIILDKHDLINLKQPINHAIPIGAPMLKIQDDIFFTCLPYQNQERYKGYNIVGKFNLKFEKFETVVPLPEIYDTGFWSSVILYQPFFTYNPHKNYFVTSMPISSYVFISDLDGKFRDSAYVGSKYFKEVKPMYDDPSYQFNKNRNYEKETAFTFANSRYSYINYDVEKKLYYRVSNPERDIVEASNDRISDFTIIVSNENFEEVTEKKFDKNKYDLFRSGFAAGKIYLARKDLYQQDDGNMVFDVIEVVTL